VVRPIARLDRKNHETLRAYAAFIAEPTDDVLSQLVDVVLGKDSEFIAWPEQYAVLSFGTGALVYSAFSRRVAAGIDVGNRDIALAHPPQRDARLVRDITVSIVGLAAALSSVERQSGHYVMSLRSTPPAFDHSTHSAEARTAAMEHLSTTTSVSVTTRRYSRSSRRRQTS
jgi:hypothetical protein